MADNRYFRLDSTGTEELKIMMSLAFENAAGGYAVGYRVQTERPGNVCECGHPDEGHFYYEGKKACHYNGVKLGPANNVQLHVCKDFKPQTIKTPRLIFYWHLPDSPPKGKEVTPFPMKIGVDLATAFAKDWLEQVDKNLYPKDCWHDVTRKPGFSIYCEDWGHVDDDSYAFVAIEPMFMWYGK